MSGYKSLNMAVQLYKQVGLLHLAGTKYMHLPTIIMQYCNRNHTAHAQYSHLLYSAHYVWMVGMCSPCLGGRYCLTVSRAVCSSIFHNTPAILPHDTPGRVWR